MKAIIFILIFQFFLIPVSFSGPGFSKGSIQSYNVTSSFEIHPGKLVFCKSLNKVCEIPSIFMKNGAAHAEVVAKDNPSKILVFPATDLKDYQRVQPLR